MSISLSLAGFNKQEKIISLSELNPTCCLENEPIASVVKKMIDEGHRRLPVLAKNKKVVGIVTTMDILGAFLRKQNFNDPISTVMNREVIFCEASEPLGTVLQKFKFSRRGGFPVIEEGRILGMVSERDIVRKFTNVNFGTRVEEAMTRKPFYISSNVSILDALKSMVNTHYRRLPVVDNRKLTGIITSADVLSYLKDNEFSFPSLAVPITPTFNKKVVSIDKEKDLSDAIRLMVEHDVGGLPVVGDDNVLEGIITERDILEEIV
jgi:CBS domain-containing protein